LNASCAAIHSSWSSLAGGSRCGSHNCNLWLRQRASNGCGQTARATWSGRVKLIGSASRTPAAQSSATALPSELPMRMEDDLRRARFAGAVARRQRDSSARVVDAGLHSAQSGIGARQLRRGARDRVNLGVDVVVDAVHARADVRDGVAARTRWGAWPPASSAARSLEGRFFRRTAWDQSPICHQTIVRGTATFCARSLRSRLFLWFRIGNPIARLAFRWDRPVVPRRTARPAINICPALGAGGGSGCCGDLVVCHIDARLVVAASG